MNATHLAINEAKRRLYWELLQLEPREFRVQDQAMSRTLLGDPDIQHIFDKAKHKPAKARGATSGKA